MVTRVRLRLSRLDAPSALYKKAFDALMVYLHDLEPVLRHLYAHYPQVWESFTAEFHQIACQTCQNDSNEFKHQSSYLVPNPTIDVMTPPLNTGVEGGPRLRPPLAMPFGSNAVPDTRSDKKKERGEKLLRRIDAKRYVPNAKLYPSFLWDETMYNKADKSRGFLRGYSIVRSIRHTWTSPHTATIGLSAKGIPQRCKARTHKQYRVIPQIVAYPVCHVYVTLTPFNWDDCPGIEKLYDDILDLFDGDDADEEWAGDTLVWLQSQVFGKERAPQLAAAANESDYSDSDSDEDTLATMKTIARARRTERDAAAASTVANANASAAVHDGSELFCAVSRIHPRHPRSADLTSRRHPLFSTALNNDNVFCSISCATLILPTLILTGSLENASLGTSAAGLT
ncbi:hypothetical protein GGX14DRAFT_393255 [Mycena pura]|uniref:Uncharacterized protein n=1 Tax=Mycena pura TaxID=153505 RepID=A0AAD6VL80_9AGAR|nr:hypothetical protein GGX14DRAFT_393255 [Mycena pura]